MRRMNRMARLLSKEETERKASERRRYASRWQENHIQMDTALGKRIARFMRKNKTLPVLKARTSLDRNEWLWSFGQYHPTFEVEFAAGKCICDIRVKGRRLEVERMLSFIDRVSIPLWLFPIEPDADFGIEEYPEEVREGFAAWMRRQGAKPIGLYRRVYDTSGIHHLECIHMWGTWCPYYTVKDVLADVNPRGDQHPCQYPDLETCGRDGGGA